MNKILYLGTDPTHFKSDKPFIHYPIIKTVPRDLHENFPLCSAFDDLPEYTHLIFTSRNTVKYFFAALDTLKVAGMAKVAKNVLKDKLFFCVGESTAEILKVQKLNFDEESISCKIPVTQTQEGLISLLRPLDLDDAYLFFPKSSLSRSQLLNFFEQRGIRHQACDLYDTVPQKQEPVPDLEEFEEIVFTSPSTVDAFLKIYSIFPNDKRLTAIGPITQEAIDVVQNSLRFL
ncbi:MAG: uroporphyrinogen-III synthase [Anaerolineae bacterium]